MSAYPRHISKSSFIAGLKCHRKLWQRIWQPQSAAPWSGIDRLRMEFGIRFGELAHELYPDAVLIEINIRKLKQAEEDTRRAIDAGAQTLLEATFRHESCRVLSDVFEKLPDGSWQLIEVKSSARVKDEHIPDLAFQKWVIENCGYRVSSCGVLYADKAGTWPDRKSLFRYEDVTKRVELAVRQIPEQLAPMLEIAVERGTPPRARQWFSKNCHDCEFKKTVCWQGITEPTIYDVVNTRKIPTLEALGVFYVSDIPRGFDLSATDRRHVNCINGKAVNVDRVAISRMLERLEYPIHFLDFESVAVAVPLFDGIHPWERLPFQYSLHILEDSGEMTHREYLHEEFSDPSEQLVERLLDDIGPAGSVVVYHAQMESGVLKDLAERFPERAERLLQVSARIWDLEKVFLKNYRHWKFGSKSSIKVVLPVLVPALSYETEDISDGGDASLSWIEMLESGDFIERQQTADALRSYCKLDTLAMAELLAHIRDVV